ncbi:MAG TPA: hypothetical protein VMU06_04040 [Stellaceae bacterium]|jgi:hypothetical protein|nr:hypothetical protein [Stellaceae bacterium]
MEVLEDDFYGSAAHDVAVLKLTAAQIGALRKYVALRLDGSANQTEAPASEYVEFVGLPTTKNRKIYQQKKIKGLIYANGGIVIKINLAKVRMAFNRPRAFSFGTVTIGIARSPISGRHISALPRSEPRPDHLRPTRSPSAGWDLRGFNV